jgi:ankyrin repeat protein
LSRKPDVNLTGILGTTALMFACKNGNINMVNELINNGADIHVKDCQNKNALSYAYENGSENIVLLLLIKGSKIVVNNV